MVMLYLWITVAEMWGKKNEWTKCQEMDSVEFSQKL